MVDQIEVNAIILVQHSFESSIYYYNYIVIYPFLHFGQTIMFSYTRYQSAWPTLIGRIQNWLHKQCTHCLAYCQILLYQFVLHHQTLNCHLSNIYSIRQIMLFGIITPKLMHCNFEYSDISRVHNVYHRSWLLKFICIMLAKETLLSNH